MSDLYWLADEQPHFPKSHGKPRVDDRGVLGSSSSTATGFAGVTRRRPMAQWLLSDRGYNADWFRDALQAKGITPCTPGWKSRSEPIKDDKCRYKSRNRIEPKVGEARSCRLLRASLWVGWLKDWRRVATRYDGCPTVFLSATALAATVLFSL